LVKSKCISWDYGSHATRSEIMIWIITCFHTTMVLTQPTLEGPRKIYSCFHTTMVLTQPRSSRLKRRQPLCFHTTMVLTQQMPGSDYGALVLFPYHYGSHATDAHRRYSKSRNNVSIPLWFSRNETLKMLSGNSKFPYHYGSHATKSYISTLWKSLVSIPLWFSRNWRTDKPKKRLPIVSIPLWFSRN